MTEDFPNPHHRAFLRLRTHLNKVAVPRHQALISPEQMRALLDLSSHGYVRCIDRNVYLTDLAPFALDIYQLTDKGVALCEAHRIAAVDP